MELLQIALMSFLSAVWLFLLTGIMGEKQISQLSLFDYVTGITIGSIAAEMATELEKNPLNTVVAMGVYALLAVVISIVTRRSVKLRRLLAGHTIILMDNGVIYRGNLKRARIDLSDLMTLARIAGYFDLSDVQTAVFEHNGNISFLPRSSKRPVTTSDMNIPVAQEYIRTNVILDGHVMRENLALTGNDHAWLMRELGTLGYKNAEDVYLATCDHENKLTAYPMVKGQMKLDRFE